MSEDNILPAISFQGVSKQFRLDPGQANSVLDMIVGTFSRSHKSNDDKKFLLAVNNASFDINPGESIGLVGRNGSGKSTILKLASGIIRPSAGRVEVRGRLSALLELGAGFHPDLTGRENIWLNASILGLSNSEIKQIYDQIVAFSELDDLIDMPVKHYSSGMYMRLGFSVAVYIDPAILLIDEILAVGDQSFQVKCIRKLHQLRERGTTIVFVSHAMDTVRSLCSRLLWISHGSIVADGPTDQIADKYEASHHSKSSQSSETLPRRWGSGEIKLVDIQLLDSNKEEQLQFVHGNSIYVNLHYVAFQPVEKPEFSLKFFRKSDSLETQPDSVIRYAHGGTVVGRGLATCQIQSLPLLPAEYRVSASVSDSTGEITYDHFDGPRSFQVVANSDKMDKGFVHIPASWETTSSPDSEASVTEKDTVSSEITTSSNPSTKSKS